MNRIIVIQGTGTDVDGQWREIPLAGTRHMYRFDGPSTTLIPTGSVEWDGDRCAEVYVPADRLDYWRAEHDIETR